MSPTLVVYIDIILNSAPTHTVCRAPDDNDKMVIVDLRPLKTTKRLGM